MVEYARILNYAIPAFLVLIAIEQGASCWMDIKVNRLFDTVSSLSSGITNVIKDILGLSIVIISYGWLVDHTAIFQIQATWSLYLVAFVGIDFAGYWTHRITHEINVFWNRHIIHHSSEEFNLACALRQSVSEIFVIFTILFIPMAILGVPANVIAVVAPLHLFAQFWYHTRLIRNMGWLESIIVTPSHHRVHHAINPEYMDRNYGQIFIIWDKLFGTFQKELDTVPPVYGVTRAVNTWNPWIINYQHIWLIIKDAWHTQSWVDKLRIWWMPTGWRPDDVASKYPVTYTTNVYIRDKYNTEGSRIFQIWIIFQLFITLGLMMFLFSNLGTMSVADMIIYGCMIFASVFAYTSLMDGSRWAIFGEAIKIILAGYLWWSWGYHWYSIDTIIMQGTTWVLSYFITSWILTYYFLFFDPIVVVSEKVSKSESYATT